MSSLPIVLFGDPILRQKSRRVSSLDGSIQQLIDDMFETMDVASGAGLAAPQINISLRIIVIGIPETEPIALINPEIVKKTGERDVTEGCLSFPGHSSEIKRAKIVVVKGIDRHGKKVRIRAEEILAQTLEHEIDHLNGILYIDYVDDTEELSIIEDKIEGLHREFGQADNT